MMKFIKVEDGLRIMIDPIHIVGYEESENGTIIMTVFDEFEVIETID